ncbi:hypothetical protein [Herbidospora solisilvae]|uniref:hypothetical protein n=1 Tax=Herbidospora solisilvae TaxID=2696284 RepID=UPI0013734008|nr:hypothetical protein [Herbidospora solisilvae]
MGGLDFFADLVITGTVLGLDHTSGRAAVESVFGRDCVPPGAVSDFGLVEFGWGRGQRRGAWEVSYFGAQAHRLPWLTAEHEIESALLDRYGGFPSRLDVGDLLTAVQTRGFTLRERSSHDGGCVEYWEPTSKMGVLAVSDSDQFGEPRGTVLKVLGPTAFLGDLGKFTDYARHLLTLSDQDLGNWLDRREPDTEPDRGDWWSCLRGVVARRTGGRPEWQRLGVVLDRYALERGVDTPDAAAVDLVLSVGRLQADDLSSMEEAVERWLAAVPPVAEVARLCAQRPVDPGDIRLARRLRNQIHAVEPFLGLVMPANEVGAWVEVKAALLSQG